MNVTRKMRAAAIAALGFALGLAGVFCFTRLHAEYYWNRALAAEGDCDIAGARRALVERQTSLLPAACGPRYGMRTAKTRSGRMRRSS